MTSENEIERDAARLLRHLREKSGFACRSPLGCGRIALYRQAGSASLGAGYVRSDVAELLISRGEAAWEEGDGTPRLRRTEAKAAEAAPKIDDRESPLLWLHRRRDKDGKPQISELEFAAGERFRADLTRAQMLPRVTMNWDASLTPDASARSGRDPGGASDSALAARQRVNEACARMGAEMSGLAIDVCGFLKGLDLVERERRWPARSAKVVLRMALATLADHYGLERKTKRRPQAWRDTDARPRIPPAAE